MSEKERRKKDGRDKNKKNQARRETEINRREPEDSPRRQEEGQSDSRRRVSNDCVQTERRGTPLGGAHERDGRY